MKLLQKNSKDWDWRLKNKDSFLVCCGGNSARKKRMNAISGHLWIPNGISFEKPLNPLQRRFTSYYLRLLPFCGIHFTSKVKRGDYEGEILRDPLTIVKSNNRFSWLVGGDILIESVYKGEPFTYLTTPHDEDTLVVLYPFTLTVTTTAPVLGSSSSSTTSSLLSPGKPTSSAKARNGATVKKLTTDYDRLELTLAADTEEICQQWIIACQELQKQLHFLQVTVSYDLQPYLGLFNVLRQSIDKDVISFHNFMINCPSTSGTAPGQQQSNESGGNGTISVKGGTATQSALNNKVLQSSLQFYNTLTQSGMIFVFHTLTLSNCLLTDSNIPHIIQVISSLTPYLQQLNLSENYLTSKGVKLLCEELIKCKYLQSLNLSHNYLSDGNSSSNTTATTTNTIGGSHGTYMEQIINCLHTLCNSPAPPSTGGNNGLGNSSSTFNRSLATSNGINQLLNTTQSSVLSCNSLQHIDLSHNRLTTRTSQLLVNKFQHRSRNCSLQSLNLSFNALGDSVMSMIEVLLRDGNSPSPVTSIDLSYCGLTEASLSILSMTITKCPGLKWLNLAGNAIIVSPTASLNTSIGPIGLSSTTGTNGGNSGSGINQALVSFLQAIRKHHTKYRPTEKDIAVGITGLEVQLGGLGGSSGNGPNGAGSSVLLSSSPGNNANYAIMRALKPALAELTDASKLFGVQFYRRPVLGGGVGAGMYASTTALEASHMSIQSPLHAPLTSCCFRVHLPSYLDSGVLPYVMAVFLKADPLSFSLSSIQSTRGSQTKPVSADPTQDDSIDIEQGKLYLAMYLVASEEERFIQRPSMSRLPLLPISVQSAVTIPSTTPPLLNPQWCWRHTISEMREEESLALLVSKVSVACQLSLPWIRKLGIRTAFIQSPPSENDNGNSEIGEGKTVNVGIRYAGISGNGLPDLCIPVYSSLHSVHTTATALSGSDIMNDASPSIEAQVQRFISTGKVLIEHDKDLNSGPGAIGGGTVLGDDEEEKILEQEELIASKVVIVEDYETWMEKENKRREERRINERLILAVRRLYAMKEVTVKMARFWEGMLGNKKYRLFAEKELIYSMRARSNNTHGLPGVSEARSTALTDANSVSSVPVGPQLNPFVFPSIAKRELLYEAMYARNISLLRAYLSHHSHGHGHGNTSNTVTTTNGQQGATSTPTASMSLGLSSSTGGQAYVYANRLINEISNLQQNFINLKRLCRSYGELILVEDYLLQCAKLGYSGPEMYSALELRQEILVTTANGNKTNGGSSKYRAMLNQDFPMIQCKAMITNLLLSRDWDKLRVKIDEVIANPPTSSASLASTSGSGTTTGGVAGVVMEEVNVAKAMLQEYDRVVELLKTAAHLAHTLSLSASAANTPGAHTTPAPPITGSISLHGVNFSPNSVTGAIDVLDQALAIAAFNNIYPPDNLIEHSLRIMENQARNPARLVKVIVEGLRNNDIHQVERGFEECMKMGLYHEALDAVICSKIHAIKNKIIQVRSTIVCVFVRL